jgi:translation initiation factor IF-3
VTEQNYRVNEKIKFSPVMLIDQNGKNLGTVSVEKARYLAREASLDLVEISPSARPPVCKIMDFGKFRYSQSLKEKKQKIQKSVQKAIRLSPDIAEHDVIVKANMARKFLLKGNKVFFQLRYKGRELAHTNLGFDVVKKIINLLEDISTVSVQPKLEGNTLSCILEPCHASKSSKH